MKEELSIDTVSYTHLKDTLDQIKKYIAAKGFTFNEGLVENYYLSLKSVSYTHLDVYKRQH